jgi:hypothetical protein
MNAEDAPRLANSASCFDVELIVDDKITGLDWLVFPSGERVLFGGPSG